MGLQASSRESGTQKKEILRVGQLSTDAEESLSVHSSPALQPAWAEPETNLMGSRVRFRSSCHLRMEPEPVGNSLLSTRELTPTCHLFCMTNSTHCWRTRAEMAARNGSQKAKGHICPHSACASGPHRPDSSRQSGLLGSGQAYSTAQEIQTQAEDPHPLQNLTGAGV